MLDYLDNNKHVGTLKIQGRMLRGSLAATMQRMYSRTWVLSAVPEVPVPHLDWWRAAHKRGKWSSRSSRRQFASPDQDCLLNGGLQAIWQRPEFAYLDIEL